MASEAQCLGAMRILTRIFLFLGCLFVAAIALFPIVHRDRRPRIYFAAESGDTNSLGQYLASGSNVNTPVVCYIYGHRTAPLLHIAARNGQTSAVDFLLKRGANPNLRDSSGSTCLYRVVGAGDGPVFQMLLKAGADPNLRSSDYGWTPLILATVLSSTNMVRSLIAAGADVNLPDSGGATPLHYVESPDIARLLLSAGANPSATCMWVWVRGSLPVTNAAATPADIALAEQRFSVLAVLTNEPLHRKD